MLKAQKQFRNYAVLALYILLTLLLSVIYVITFTSASQDADKITARIADRNVKQRDSGNGTDESKAGTDRAAPQDNQQSVSHGRFGPMGPSSPEAEASLRYFTVAFDKDGNYSDTVSFNISAVTEEEAVAWAKSLLKEKTGWSRGTYRFRVVKANGQKYVTVIDQGRELLAAYRILIVSLTGGIILLIISFFILNAVGIKIFSPIEEAERKQKKFIERANRDIRLPLTIISANTELIEREHGADDQTHAIRRQVKKLENLVNQLDDIAMYEADRSSPVVTNLSQSLLAYLQKSKSRFDACGLILETDIAPDITVEARQVDLSHIFEELISNSLRYSISKVKFSLSKEDERILLSTSNDADLEDSEDLDCIFDRFTKMKNSSEDCAGIGLSHVKNIVKSLNGRVSAKANGGIFTLNILL